MRTLTILTTVLLVAAGCGGTAAVDLREGQCFDGSVEGSVTSVKDVPCDQPHDHEVYAVFQYQAQGNDYPGQEAVGAYGEEECIRRFEEFVGVEPEQSIATFATLWPSAETWALGDRAIVCTVSSKDDGKLTGSMKGTKR